MIRPPYNHGWRKPLSRKAQDRLAVVVLLWVSLFLGAVLFFASNAKAAPGVLVTVEVAWTGCADVTAPDSHDPTRLITAVVCDPPASPAPYLVQPGQMYGAAVFSPGSLVSCRVLVGGREVAYRAALGAANCLDTWE